MKLLLIALYIQLNNSNSSSYRKSLQGELKSHMTNLTGVFSTATVSCTHHFIVDDDIDSVRLVPPLTQAIVDDGHIHSLQGFWSETRTLTKYSIDVFNADRAVVEIWGVCPHGGSHNPRWTGPSPKGIS